MSYDISESGSPDAPPGADAEAVQPRLSQIFSTLAENATGAISIGTIRDALGDRSFAALLVLFAALNLLPLPPGATLVLGLPLLLVSGQMVLGYRNPWLPRMLLRKTVDAGRFRRASTRLIPLLERLERLVTPRNWPFSPAASDRIIGAITLVLGLAVTLPIPLGNWLPAFAIAILGLALSERDGIFFVVGVLTGLASFAIIGAVVGTAGFIAGAVFGLHF